MRLLLAIALALAAAGCTASRVQTRQVEGVTVRYCPLHDPGC